MTENRLTLRCSSCHSEFRILEAHPPVVVGALRHCPKCGSDKAIGLQDLDTDYWEAMADAFNMPVTIVKELYAQWDWKAYHRFRDFVEAWEGAA